MRFRRGGSESAPETHPAGEGEAAAPPRTGDLTEGGVMGTAESADFDPGRQDAAGALLAEREAEISRLSEQLQRLQAEFDNYRKRNLREREDWTRRAQADLLARLLPIVDDLKRAEGHAERAGRPPDPEGLLLILRRLAETLAQVGLEELTAAPGTEFDPSRQEAVQAVPSKEIEEGHVIEVFETGWTFGGQILRASKVRVSSGPPEG